MYSLPSRRPPRSFRERFSVRRRKAARSQGAFILCAFDLHVRPTIYNPHPVPKIKHEMQLSTLILLGIIVSRFVVAAPGALPPSSIQEKRHHHHSYLYPSLASCDGQPISNITLSNNCWPVASGKHIPPIAGYNNCDEAAFEECYNSCQCVDSRSASWDLCKQNCAYCYCYPKFNCWISPDLVLKSPFEPLPELLEEYKAEIAGFVSGELWNSTACPPPAS